MKAIDRVMAAYLSTHTPAFPLVDCEPVDGLEPDELAVSRLFMPGEVGTFAELPAPLGSLPELFNRRRWLGHWVRR